MTELQNSLQDLVTLDFLGPFCYRTGMDRRYWRAYDPDGQGLGLRELYIMDDFGNLVQI